MSPPFTQLAAAPATTRVAAVTEKPDRQRARARRRRRQTLVGWLFAGPVVIGALAFQLAPVATSLWVSLTDWTGLNTPSFLGLRNYLKLFTSDPEFYASLLHTAIFTVALVVVSIAGGLVLALLCNQRIRGIAFFRTLYFSPFVTNVVAIGFVWFWIYDPNNGLINGTLKMVGISGPAWLSDPSFALLAVIIVAVWQGVGYPMVILLAGLQQIDKALLESARVDGANGWNRFWNVTFPLLTPSIFFLMITQFIASFQVFGIIYVMTSGGPGNSTSVFIFQIYQTAFSHGQLGYASAMGWVLFLIVGVVTVLQWLGERKWVHYGN